jgi:hypothetical protein
MVTTAVGNPFLIGSLPCLIRFAAIRGGAAGTIMRHVFLSSLPVRPGFPLKVEKIPHRRVTFLPHRAPKAQRDVVLAALDPPVRIVAGRPIAVV